MKFPKKKWRPTSKAVSKESELQRMCEGYLKCLQIMYIRIPDVVYKTGVAGSLRGVPDLTVLFRTGEYVCVELKSKLGHQTTGQKQFEYAVGSQNYYIIDNFNDFTELIKKIYDCC